MKKIFMTMGSFFVLCTCVAMDHDAVPLSSVTKQFRDRSKSLPEIMISARDASPRMQAIRRESIDNISTSERVGEGKAISNLKRIHQKIQKQKVAKTRSQSYETMLKK